VDSPGDLPGVNLIVDALASAAWPRRLVVAAVGQRGALASLRERVRTASPRGDGGERVDSWSLCSHFFAHTRDRVGSMPHTGTDPSHSRARVTLRFVRVRAASPTRTSLPYRPPSISSTFRARKSKISSRSRRTTSRWASSPNGPQPIA
jgi:hypothetical protein